MHLGHRRAWTGRKRVHIEVRLPKTDIDGFARAIRDELEALAGVEWARLNVATRRVVVSFIAEPPSDEVLIAAVERIERRFGLDGEATWRGRRPFPGDQEPVLRFAVEIGADALGFGAGLGLRMIGVKLVPSELSLAAVVSLLEYVPSLREVLEDKLGPGSTDLALNLAGAFSSALVQGSTGPIVDALGRALRLREIAAHVDAWTELEDQLDRPEAHESTQRVEPRTSELPPGPIERYTSQVLAATTGAFGFSFIASRDLARSTVSVFGGTPKPAVAGREAFAADLGRKLAERKVVVMDPAALRLLDRITCVVVPEELLRPRGARVEAIVPIAGFNDRDARRNVMRLLDLGEPRVVHEEDTWWLGPYSALEGPRTVEVAQTAERLLEPGGVILALRHRGAVVALVSLIPMADPAVEAFAAAVRRAELSFVAAGERPTERGWVEPDRYIGGGDELVGAIKLLQADGHGVCFIGRGASPGYRAADLGIGLLDTSGAELPPWGAKLICRTGLVDASLVIAAVHTAKQAARQAIYLAMVEAASALVLSVGGLRSQTVKRVMTAANATTLLAMANSIRLARGVEPVEATAQTDPTPWHTLELEQVLERLSSRLQGLSAAEAKLRQRPKPPPPSALSRFGETIVDELANPLAPVLVAGAGLSALTGAVIDAAMIGGVVGLNALLGAVQRHRTDKALGALDQTQGEKARIVRGAELLEFDPDELVVGDVLVLEAGDSVLADARILEARGLELDESSLTGESLPISKSPAPSFAAAVADRTSMVFEGTTVAAGECKAVVTAVGEATESRRAALRSHRTTRSGVEARLDALTDFTAPVAALSGVALMTAGLSLNRPAHEVISSGVSLAVAAVPEGLPLLATMAQLAAARRLSERGALVRNPRAIEALGRANVLCADKTGTLTQGKLELMLVADASHEGGLTELDERLQLVLRAALRASPQEGGETLPHATDRSLIEGAHAAGLHRHRDVEGFTLLSELPFEPARGYHAVFGRLADNGQPKCLLSVKGSPEAVLPRCTSKREGAELQVLDEAGRTSLVEAAVALASRGLRVLAVAERTIPARDHVADRHVVELTFLGFVAFADPVRESAKQALDALRRAGVDVVMITGDHPSTATAIGRELGLPVEEVLSGSELDQLDDAALDQRIARTFVCARVTPAQKVRIVQSLQRLGRVVGMTGDGANDAPAIRLADVGIAVGEGATPAARKAADIVVTDNRIETIVDAVLEGRALWRSVRDAVALLVGGNFGEIGFTVIHGLIEGRSPLNARQLLLVNMLTDTAPSLAVALRRPRRVAPEDLLREGPEASLGSALTRDIVWRAVVTGGATTAAWLVARVTGTRERANTVALLTLVGSQLGQTLLLGGRDPMVLAAALGSAALLLAVVETPGISQFFGSTPLGPIGLGEALLASAAATGVALVGPRVIDWGVERLRGSGQSNCLRQPG